jgi:extracellular elastinolytic metalloproteinase
MCFRIDQLAGEHRIKITAFSGMTGNPSSIASHGARAQVGTWLQYAVEHVHAISPALGLSAAQVPEFRTIEHVPETSSGARAVHLHQLYKGIPIFQAALMVRYDPAGNLIDAVGETMSVDHDLPAVSAIRNRRRVIAKSERTSARCARYFFQAA